MNNFIEQLSKTWFIILALVGMSVAWGQQQMKIQNLEEAVKHAVLIQKEVSEIKMQSIRQEERALQMIENQAQQQRLLELLLANQREKMNQQ